MFISLYHALIGCVLVLSVETAKNPALNLVIPVDPVVYL